MKQQLFVVECKFSPLHTHNLLLRNIYLPIIGHECINLYGFLLDFYVMNQHKVYYEHWGSLTQKMGMKYNDVRQTLLKLEAVGLVRTFENGGGDKNILVLNPPLDPEKTRKNPLLFRNLVAKISEEEFEKISAFFEVQQLNKSEFNEVTTKYQDLFLINQPRQVVESTLELPLATFKSLDEAIKHLNSFQFIRYLQSDKITPSQLEIVNQCTQNGFSNVALNHVINYVFKINNKVVVAHLRKIIDDFAKRDIFSEQVIEKELQKAQLSRAQQVGDERSTNFENLQVTPAPLLPDWDDLFMALGSEL